MGGLLRQWGLMEHAEKRASVKVNLRWSRKLGQRFRNYKLRNYEKNQTRIQFSVQS